MLEFEAEGVELRRMPAGAQTQHETPIAYLVERVRLPGDHARVAERRAHNERPELDALGRLGQRGHDRPVLPYATARSRFRLMEQMVGRPDRIEAALVGDERESADLLVAHALADRKPNPNSHR